MVLLGLLCDLIYQKFYRDIDTERYYPIYLQFVDWNDTGWRSPIANVR